MTALSIHIFENVNKSTLTVPLTTKSVNRQHFNAIIIGDVLHVKIREQSRLSLES